jgi:hypothetical protein
MNIPPPKIGALQMGIPPKMHLSKKFPDDLDYI